MEGGILITPLMLAEAAIRQREHQAGTRCGAAMDELEREGIELTPENLLARLERED